NRPDHAYTWHWFFNYFASVRFEKAVALDGLRRHLLGMGYRLPSARTLDRDMACMLRSYSVVVPPERSDPEDSLECPLSELGLLLHFRNTGSYQLDRSVKPIPFEIFSYAVSRAQRSPQRASSEIIDISLNELTHSANLPGRVFCL